MPKKSILPTLLALAALGYAAIFAPGMESPTASILVWLMAAFFSLWAIVKWAPSLLPSVSAKMRPLLARRRAKAEEKDR